MSALLLLVAALAVQAGPWRMWPAQATVGDSVRIERLLPAARGVAGRTRALEASEYVEPLRAPEFAPAERGLLVRHTLALFAPGRHVLAMPAIELVHPDGHVELVVGDTAVVEIRAVVPDTMAVPTPRASQAPLGRGPRRAAPLVLLVGGTAVVLGVWVAVRRRRRRRMPVPPPPTEVLEPPLLRWLAAGERRAVATLAAERVRRRVESLVPEARRGLGLPAWLDAVQAGRPEWPVRELEDVLEALERARFAPLAGDDAAELVDRADQLIERLTAPAEGDAA